MKALLQLKFQKQIPNYVWSKIIPTTIQKKRLGFYSNMLVHPCVLLYNQYRCNFLPFTNISDVLMERTGNTISYFHKIISYIILCRRCIGFSNYEHIHVTKLDPDFSGRNNDNEFPLHVHSKQQKKTLFFSNAMIVGDLLADACIV